jgi:hypothetical protein
VVGRAASVLAARAPARLAALAALGAALGLYYAFSDSLWNASTWWDVAWLGVVLIPVVFLLDYLVLPLMDYRGLPLVAIALAAFAVICTAADLDAVANFAKLGAVTFAAFWFLSYFETLGWIVLVAAIIPWVDAWSVWRGPTHVIVTQKREIFTTLSFAFPTPGEHTSANLGLPDLLFFALFLAATVRFRLRTRLTWLLMAASFGITLALSVWLELGGLPALPGLSIAFMLANGDLLWRRLRPRPRPAASI